MGRCIVMVFAWRHAQSDLWVSAQAMNEPFGLRAYGAGFRCQPSVHCRCRPRYLFLFRTLGCLA